MERVQADRQQQFSRTMPDGTMVNFNPSPSPSPSPSPNPDPKQARWSTLTLTLALALALALTLTLSRHDGQLVRRAVRGQAQAAGPGDQGAARAAAQRAGEPRAQHEAGHAAQLNPHPHLDPDPDPDPNPNPNPYLYPSPSPRPRPRPRQVKLYKNLGKLLRCKQDMQKAARAELNQMAHENEQETNVFTMPDGPAEPQALD